jgi:hypothetical protein
MAQWPVNERLGSRFEFFTRMAKKQVFVDLSQNRKDGLR